MIMNCPHVSVRLSESLLGVKNNGHNNANGRSFCHEPSLSFPFVCAVCKSSESPWLCLDCGSIHCGRYINGHAKAHYKDKKHCISVDCYCITAYCYICDDYIQPDVIPQPIIERLNSNPILNNTESFWETSESADEEDAEQSEGSSGDEVSSGAETSVDGVCDNKIYGGTGMGPRTRSGSYSGVNCNSSLASRQSRRARRQGLTIPKPKVSEKNLRKRNSNSVSSNSSINSGHGQSNRNFNDLNEDGVDAKKIKLVDERESSTEEINGTTTPTKRAKANGGKSNGVVNKNCRRAKENESSLEELDKSSKHGVVGLRNLGNTCFMNAVLQSLSKIHGFSCYLSHIPPPDELTSAQLNGSNPKPKYSTRSQKNALLSYKASTLGLCGDTNEIRTTEEFLTSELRKILILLNTKGSSAVSPNGLFTAIWEVMPRFRGYQQQDAHEFLRYMLDRLHCELVHLVPRYTWNNLENGKSSGLGEHNGTSNTNGHRSESYLSSIGYAGNKSKSIVTSMFGGLLQNEVRCCRCGTESKKHDPFLDLSLDIPCAPAGTTKLEDCLSRFTDIEELSDSDMYFCSNCKTHQKSTKRFWISRLPNVLCLHLKRFRFSSSVRSKLDHFVQFPMKALDMSEYILNKFQSKKSPSPSKSNVYDLAAVIVHHGTGVGSGHYTAYAKKDVQWYHFNDSTVKPSEESAVAKCKAYILFYTRGEIKI